MTTAYTTFEFNYASIFMKPYSGNSGTSSQLLKNIILKLNEDEFPSQKRVIDRHLNRKNTVSRKLVIISNRFENKGARCFGRIALIKNKAPLIWGGKDIVEQIEKESNKQFIEITNYTINFSTDSEPIIMFEFNSEGPRLSDIEFYIRQIAKEFRLAKNIQTSLHLKTSYEQLDKQMNNVFGLTVKVNAAYNNKFNWLKALKNLNDDSGFKDVRLELFFNRRKNESGKYEKNIRGTDFARGIITWLRKDKKNIDYVDDLKMSYQTDDSDNIIELDFLKNKVVSILKIPLTDKRVYKPADFRFIVGQEFNYYLNNGVTKSES